MDFKALWEDMWNKSPGKLLGTLLGVLLGIGIILFGLFNTLFVLLCGLVGLYVGKRVDEKSDFADLKALFYKLIPPGFRR